MRIKVLVVDDSGFFRRQITKLLSTDKGLEVIDTAENGKDAVEKALRLEPDVITMDIEMPVMDGITATREILRHRRIPILMFSSLTTEGAQATLNAMDAGAVDFIPKRFEDISSNRDEVGKLLCNKIREIGSHGRTRLLQAKVTADVLPKSTSRVIATSTLHSKFKLLAIGTSTGGPLALQEVLKKLPKDFPLPIVLVQHMPSTFTPAFAKRLDQICNISVKEGASGDVLKPGHAYLAPGGKQMEVVKHGGQLRLDITDGASDLTYKPSVDVTFSSIAKILPNSVLAVMLTGMGADGCEGAKKIKLSGSVIWAQDEASSVVWGMPSAVVEAGVVEKILPLNDIGNQIARVV
ncbi:MAG: chemotaxis response regulator protein-glutamate methylesterase [Gammaproteobacteria bacterium]|nr:chemotaxis response regulator protein-glutamate methylesterase [Gammaproteobacteria bacterium]